MEKILKLLSQWWKEGEELKTKPPNKTKEAASSEHIRTPR